MSPNPLSVVVFVVVLALGFLQLEDLVVVVDFDELLAPLSSKVLGSTNPLNTLLPTPKFEAALDSASVSADLNTSPKV
jgi:hypothetical protein